MKKILSAFLMVVVTLQVATMDVLALGKDEVVWNSDGSKTIFVSSEKLDDYLNGLQKEIDQCWHEYKWGDFWTSLIAEFLSVSLPTALVTFSTYKIIDFLNRHMKKTAKENKVEIAFEGTEDKKHKVVEKTVGSLEKKDYVIIALECAVLGLSAVLGMTCGFDLYHKFFPFKDASACIGKESRNNQLIKLVENRKLEDGLDIYGIEVDCNHGGGEVCSIKSQKYLFKPNIL